MFPTSTLQQKIEDYLTNLEQQDFTVKNTPLFDFEQNSIKLKNGNPIFADEIEAIKQWIILFVTTPKDIYPIYAGTNFGTSLRKLFGQKRLNNGYEEAELEREIKEGLPMCPAILSVPSVDMTKVGKILQIVIQTELFNGDLITVKIEQDIFNIK